MQDEGRIKMKRKIISLFLTIMVFISAFPTLAMAAMPSVQYELRAENATNLKIGDEFVVSLYVNRLDSAEDYTVSLLQDEIEFDGALLEYVESGNDFTDALFTSENVGYNSTQNKIKSSFVSLTELKTLTSEQLLFKVKFRVKALPSTGNTTLITNSAMGVADNEGNRNNNVVKQDATLSFGVPKEITAFSFNGLTPVVTGVINQEEKTVSLTVPYGTDVTNIAATFATTGTEVKVDSVKQESGITTNNFSAPVVYDVVGYDGSTQSYTVTVTVAPNTAKQITSFSFDGLNPKVTATINETNKTISATVPYGTSVTNLIATFVTTGSSVKIGDTVQVSGTTANDFTNALIYKVFAADGTTTDYTVTVTVASNSGGGSGGSGGGNGGGSGGGSGGSGGSSIPPTPIVPTNNFTFKDVKETDWYYEAVKFAFEKGITSGVSETSYAPNDKVTRGQFITMLCRAYGIKEMTGDNFADCGNTWYTGYLAAAKQLGISNGVGDNKFAPEKEITREEMVTLIYNYLKSVGKVDAEINKTTFTDDDAISDWAKNGVAFASSKGYVNGKGNNIFDPSGDATRAELAQIFFNMFK